MIGLLRRGIPIWLNTISRALINFQSPDMKLHQILIDEAIFQEFLTDLTHILRVSNRSAALYRTNCQFRKHFHHLLDPLSFVQSSTAKSSIKNKKETLRHSFIQIGMVTVQISEYFAFLPTFQESCTENQGANCGRRFWPKVQMQPRDLLLKMTWCLLNGCWQKGTQSTLCTVVLHPRAR